MLPGLLAWYYGQIHLPLTDGSTFTERMVRLLEAGEFGLVYELILHIYFRMKTIF